MKFMKLGLKPDAFKSEKDNIRYVATELATDFLVIVGEIKFHLHKFPLLCKSTRMQKLVAADTNADHVDVSDIPGGASAFEICAKFCYGMAVTLNAYNVVAARCAAEYLEMYDAVEKGNLVSKLDVFINSCIFRSWKDTIIVLQSTRQLNAVAEELKLTSRCLDCISQKACIETSKVDWSYSYNWKKLPAEDAWNHHRQAPVVPSDWWVEDLCDLNVDMYKRVISRIKSNGSISSEVIGKALMAYTARRLPGFSKEVQVNDTGRYKQLAEVIIKLLPDEIGSVPCDFLLKLLRTTTALQCGDGERKELMNKISQQLGDATVSDLLIRSPPGSSTMYDIEILRSLVKEFAAREVRSVNSDACRAAVAKLVDGYLAEVSKDSNLHVSMFVDFYEAASGLPRRSHDDIYRAIDIFLKEHPGIGKSEKKRICRLMDCRKLSPEACAHAVQNERLPLRVVVQVLFFEQVRQVSAADRNSLDVSGPLKAYGSSRTTTDEEWESMPAGEERWSGDCSSGKTVGRNDAERAAAALKMKSSLGSKILMKLWSNKSLNGDVSSSDTSSPGSTNADEVKAAYPNPKNSASRQPIS